MNKIIFITIFFIMANISFASVTPADKCATLQCVRKNIDSIDQKLVKLIGERLTYVKRAGELKKNAKSIHDQSRENKILKSVGKQAQQTGYPATIAIAIFKTILAQANIYEKSVR